jgi:hypothetical protein
MSKARTVSARARALATKRSVQLIAVFAFVAVATAAAATAPASAKLIKRLINSAPAISRPTRAAAVPVGLSATDAEEKAAIATDKTVYGPGETVTFNGANWTPGESVTIVLTSNAHDSDGITVTATADENGSFVAKAALPGDADAPGSNGNGRGQSSSNAEVMFTAVATGSSGATARARFKQGEGAEDGAEDDADLPAFLVGKINKEDYLARRAEHINRLRGIERGRPFDPGARGRAIGQLERQEGRNRSSKKSSAAVANAAGSTGTTGAQTTGFGGMTMAALDAAVNSPSWTPVGPAPLANGQTFGVTQPVSGRVTAIAINPTNSDIAYVGTAQGGVYRTLDGGQSWTAVFDNAQSLAIGSIAIAPSQPSTIYVGTGEPNQSCDSFFGVGVYRIDNADSTSPQLSGPFNKDGSNNDVMTGRAVAKIVVHPTDPNTIFVGTASGVGGIGCDTGTATSSRGLYRSTNAASASPTFQKLTTSTASTNRSVLDIEFEPGNPNTVLATVYGFNTANDGGVYRSTNALAPTPAFTQTLSTGTATVAARVELTVNKVGGVVTVFAGISDSNGTLKRSVDGGQTWSAAISSVTGFCGTQCYYDIPVTVDPTNANVLYVGGNADGTATAILKKSVNALSASPTFSKVQTGLHADSHAVEIDPSNNNTVWFGSDGGVWKSTNGAGTWVSLNNSGFNATQFQSIALHPTDPNYTIGGSQDNGTERERPDGSWTRTDFGDGGYALIDQNAANTTTVRQYHTYFNQVGTGGLVALATTTSSTAFENWSAFGCGATANGLSCNDTAVAFYAPMALGPGNPNTLYFGTDRLYRSTNNGTTMTVVSQGPFVSGVYVSAIGVSPQNDAVRVVGLRTGKVYRTVTGGSTAATMADVTGTIPARYVARAVVDPNNPNTAYVTLATYFGDATSHVYKTTNLSAASPTWAGIDGGQIPDVPVNAFAVDPADSNTLYAGTDIGVYRSVDGGATWSPFSTGLPRVAVFDMAIQNSARTLRIATHGRGMWEMSIASTPAVLRGTVTDAATHAPVANATVTAGSNTATTGEDGVYQFPSIPAATYSMTVSAIGYGNATASGVTATNGSVTTKDFALTSAPASACNTDTTQADFQSGLPSNIDTATSPGNVTLALPGAVTESQTSLAFFVDSITTTNWQAQTFIPGATGQLKQADFQAALSSTGTAGTMVVEIRNTVSGAPGSTVLASANISTVTSTTNAWYTANFAAPANVTAGTQYALVLRAASGGPYRAVRANGNVYANGSWLQSTTSGSSWAVVTSGGVTQDLAFTVYVTPQVYATDGNLVSLPKDANQSDGTAAGWSTISWNATTPAGTSVKFQAAAGNSPTGLFTFVGPDGTPNTYFANGGSLAQFNGQRYLKYKAYLKTTNTAVTPTLADVTICNSNTPLPATTLNVAPATATYGGTTTLAATLTSGGNPVAGKAVTFKLNGANFAGNSATTDASGVATIQNVSLSGVNAGTYAGYVTAKFASDSSYAGTTGSSDLTVAKATPNVSWSNPGAITYGTALDSTQLNATADVPGSFVYTPPAGTVLGAGDNQTLHVEFTPTDSANYNKVLKDVSINVQKAQATVSLSDLVQNYNGSPKSATATVSPSGLSGLSVTYNGSTTPPVNAGSYAVVASLTNHNYRADDATGTLVINKVAPVVTVNGNTCTYSGSSCEGSGMAKGVDGTDLGPVTLTYTPGGASAPVNAGDYTVVASIGETANHTAGTSDSVAVKVNKAAPVINWTSPSPITYGTPLGAAQLNATATRGAGGPTVAGDFAYGPAAGTVLAVGNGQTLHVEFTPTDPANYTTASKDVTIDVRQTLLTVKVVDSSKLYGQPNPAFTVSYSGFVNNEGPANLGGSLAFTTAATQTSGAGAYAVTPSGLTSSSYAINFVDGTLVVKQAPLTVTADNKSKIYGQANPAFTASFNGFVLGEGPANLGGTLSFATPATQSSGAGVYPITPSGLTSANYAITFVAGGLTVNKAALVVTADNKTKILGAANPAFTASYSGFVLGEGPSVLGGTLAFSTPATAASGVGSYVVTPSGLTSPNYAITFANGTLVVTYGVCVQYDQTQAAQSGSTIPIKLQLCNASGGDVSSASTVAQATGVTMVSTSAPASLAYSGNANPDFNFRYTGPGVGTGYIFNLSTKGYATGTYLLTFTATGDPAAHTVQFSVR